LNEIIRIENLTHTYGEGTPFRRSAVENLSLDIYHGEFLGLIGHTGSGKSTLIQHLNGLLKPTGGRVLLDGEDIWADPKKIRSVRFRVGLVFQYPEYQLFEETVYRDIAFGPTNMGLTGAELDRRVHDAARFAGLDEGLLQKSPFELSGGQKQPRRHRGRDRHGAGGAGARRADRRDLTRAGARSCLPISAPIIRSAATPSCSSATRWMRSRRTWTASPCSPTLMCS